MTPDDQSTCSPRPTSSRDEVEAILDTAASMHDVQNREVKKMPTLRGRTVINLFFEDSTRTRSSFEIAGKWMSADTINIIGQGLVDEQGREPARHRPDRRRDGRRRPRHPPPRVAAPATRSRSGCDASVINAGDGTHEHPTQALLDAYTLRSAGSATSTAGTSSSSAT